MTVEPIGWITLFFGVLGFYLEPTFLVYFFFASTLLGAAAAIIVSNLGGTTIQPAHLMLGFLALRLMVARDTREGALRSIGLGRPAFWLLVTMIYTTITAFLLPRLFAGDTLTYVVRVQGANYAMPLGPTTSNLTQSVYFIGDFVAFFVLSGFGSSESGRRCMVRAALACVILNLFFVAADLVTYATNTSDILSYIRNSTYSTLSDTELAGAKRIVGSFVEPSSFSYWTLGYFAFSLSLWLSGIVPRLTLPLSCLSLLSLLFSTSTTAYAGLVAFLSIQYIATIIKLFRSTRPQVLIFVVMLPFICAVAAVLILLNDTTSAYVGDLLDTTVFSKLSSASGVERSAWNGQAMQNFFDTFGFGVGNGSVRASSFPVAVMASFGVVGAVLYGLFLAKIFFSQIRTAASAHIATQVAAKSACLAWLIAATISAAFVDLGLPFFAFAALACAEPRVRRVPLQKLDDRFHESGIDGTGSKLVDSLFETERGVVSWPDGVRRSNWR